MSDPAGKNALKLKSELEKLQNDFVKTWNKREQHKLSQLYSENSCIMAPEQPPVYNRAGAAKIIGKQIEKGFVNIFLSTLELESSGSDLVVERGGYKYSNKDKQILETGKYIMVWKRVDSDLQLHMHIWNRNN